MNQPSIDSNTASIEVLLVTYNHEKYIETALRSIEIQDYPGNIFVKVYDDSSTDKTVEIIKDFSKSSRHSYVFVRNDLKYGIERNYERSFRNIQNKWVAILEGDDFWFSKNHLSENVRQLNENPFANLSFSSVLLLTEESNRLVSKQYPTGLIFNPYDLAHDNFIGNFSCCVYRSESLIKVVDKFVHFKGFDWLLNLLVGYQSYYLRSFNSYSVYRIHKGGYWSSLSKLEQISGIMSALTRYDEALNYEYTEAFDLHYQRGAKLTRAHKLYEIGIVRNLWKLIKIILPTRLSYCLKDKFISYPAHRNEKGV